MSSFNVCWILQFLSLLCTNPQSCVARISANHPPNALFKLKATYAFIRLITSRDFLSIKHSMISYMLKATMSFTFGDTGCGNEWGLKKMFYMENIFCHLSSLLYSAISSMFFDVLSRSEMFPSRKSSFKNLLFKTSSK